MIEIRSLFTDWHEASRAQAAVYVRHLLEGITMPMDKAAYIERHRLRGISVAELLKEEVNEVP